MTKLSPQLSPAHERILNAIALGARQYFLGHHLLFKVEDIFFALPKLPLAEQKCPHFFLIFFADEITSFASGLL